MKIVRERGTGQKLSANEEVAHRALCVCGIARGNKKV